MAGFARKFASTTRPSQALFLVLLLCAGLTAGAQHCGRSKVGATRIVGGTTASPGQWPWQAALLGGPKQAFFCGATLISDRWALTAAHCFYGKNMSTSMYHVKLGTHDLRTKEDTEVVLQTSKIVLHPGYNRTTIVNDIALVRLAQRVNLSSSDYVNVACLPQANDSFVNATGCYSTGWGLTQGPQDKKILQMVSSAVISHSKCQKYFSSVVDHTKICFGNGQQGACKGDSGGPLVCPRGDGAYVVAGVVSYGTSTCTKTPYPTVYTSVAAFRQWVQAVAGL